MRHINLKGNNLIVTFKFDPTIVSAIRGIDGRKWNAGAKHWEIPKENLEDALKVLVPLGFTPHIDVVNLKKEQEKLIIDIENIKLSGEKYTGTLPLYEFQKIGASFLKQMPASLLADVPGLGKTIQTIGALEGVERILVFCPSSLKYSWKEEIERWDPNADVVVVDGKKEDRFQCWNRKNQWTIANYELLIHDFDNIPKEWGAIVCDEATRISNPDAQTVRNLKTIKTKKRIALTGTPISNRPDDIWSIIDWLVPGYLGTFYQFRQKYCIENDYGRVVGYKNLDQLSSKVNRFMLRRMKNEVFTDFPPKTVLHINFELSETERTLYQAVKEQVIDDIKKLSDLDTKSLGIIPVKMLRLKQATGHTKLVGGYGNGESTKLDTLRMMLKPIIESGEKAIIFSQFAEMLHILREELREFRPLVIYGDVSSVERMVAVKEFNDDPLGRIIIMTEAGAYGLNMQSALYVFHYDAPWSVAKLNQREDRAHRHGVKGPVTVYHLVARNTIDEYVIKTLHRKNKISVDILQDVDRLEEMGLSKEDIDEILKL